MGNRHSPRSRRVSEFICCSPPIWKQVPAKRIPNASLHCLLLSCFQPDDDKPKVKAALHSVETVNSIRHERRGPVSSDEVALNFDIVDDPIEEAPLSPAPTRRTSKFLRERLLEPDDNQLDPSAAHLANERLVDPSAAWTRSVLPLRPRLTFPSSESRSSAHRRHGSHDDHAAALPDVSGRPRATHDARHVYDTPYRRDRSPPPANSVRRSHRSVACTTQHRRVDPPGLHVRSCQTPPGDQRHPEVTPDETVIDSVDTRVFRRSQPQDGPFHRGHADLRPRRPLNESSTSNSVGDPTPYVSPRQDHETSKRVRPSWHGTDSRSSDSRPSGSVDQRTSSTADRVRRSRHQVLPDRSHRSSTNRR